MEGCEWNRVKVRCVGKYLTITTWINGVKICEFNGATLQDDRYDREKVRQTLGEKGSIVVQVHGGLGWPKGTEVW